MMKIVKLVMKQETKSKTVESQKSKSQKVHSGLSTL